VGPPGADELLVFEPGEPDRPLGPSPAMFTAPQWTREGDEVVVAQRMRDAETDWLRIVAVDRAGAVRPLTAGVEYARFCLAPDGRRLAHVGARRHVLMVRDLSTRDDEELSIDRPVLFEWSADGSALLALEGGLLGTTPLVRYRVWSEHAAETYAWHYPSQVTGRQILPFAEQYVRSRTAWAPDGMAFAYAGASTDGDAGIWVQHRTRAQPELVCGGWTVSWRPSPAVTPDR